jgi:GDP-4-dehydro-6-deoxy-D-mannose reductase
MSDKSVLITGATGFVGKHLSSLLNSSGGFQVHGTRMPEESSIDLPGVDLVECRLENCCSVREAVNRTNPNVVYHLAAQSSVPRSLEDPAGTYETNVVGTVNLLEALREERDLRAVVLISSAEVYGIVSEEELPITEDAQVKPGNPYAFSKICSEIMGEAYFRDFGMPVIRLRSFNHIGPGQSDSFVTSSFARQIAEIESGLRPPSLMVGNLESSRDFTDVRDVVRAYEMAATSCVPGELYNISSGRAVKISDILQSLLAMTEAKIEVTEDPARMRPSDLPILTGDSSKFRKATGWSPQIPLETTLKDLLDYWRQRQV